jgi:L-alanine-DL-glutamate epimerase-like enolase superfamily enzyme
VKITDARVVVSSPGRNYVTLVIETADGLVGVGDATLNGRELAVASYLGDHVCPRRLHASRRPTRPRRHIRREGCGTTGAWVSEVRVERAAASAPSIQQG